MKKVKGTFGTIYNPMTMEKFIKVEEVAKELAKSWGDIPKSISNARAIEIHLLGKAYLTLLKKLNAHKDPK